MVRPHNGRCRDAGPGFLLSRADRPAVSRAVRSQAIRPQSWPLQSKIWTAAAPSINHVPSGTMGETAVPGTAKDDNAMTSKAAQAARRSERAQARWANVCMIRSCAITYDQRGVLAAQR